MYAWLRTVPVIFLSSDRDFSLLSEIEDVDERHTVFIEERDSTDEEEDKGWAVAIDEGGSVSVVSGAPRAGNNSERNYGESFIQKQSKPAKGGKRVSRARPENMRKEEK